MLKKKILPSKHVMTVLKTEKAFRQLRYMILLSLFSVLSYGYELTIKHDNQSHILSQTELKDINKGTLTTITPWTNTNNTYSGISLKALIAHYNIQGTKVYAKALNDYQVEISVSEALAADAFIVSYIDGVPMKIRNKGPFWLIFPWSVRPELSDRKYQDWAIWQLTELSFH